MHEKGELSKIEESICNIPIEAVNICNILPRLAVYIQVINQALAYLKSQNKFYKDISITKGLSSEAIIRFSDINVKIQEENECYKKNFRWERNEGKYK